jgi:hypothetical protein
VSTEINPTTSLRVDLLGPTMEFLTFLLKELSQSLVAFIITTHYATVSAKYGHWDATPEENAAVGIRVSSPQKSRKSRSEELIAG